MATIPRNVPIAPGLRLVSISVPGTAADAFVRGLRVLGLVEDRCSPCGNNGERYFFRFSDNSEAFDSDYDGRDLASPGSTAMARESWD